MTERKVLPVLPIRGAVIFPGPAVTLSVSRPNSLRAVETAMKEDRRVFAVTQREAGDTADAHTLYTMGVIARIEQAQMGLGALQLVVVGEQRGTAVDYRAGELLRAVVMPVIDIPPLHPEDPAFAALFREVRERALELGKRRGIAEEALRRVLESVSDPGAFSDLVAHYLEIDATDKQQILETPGVEARLRRVLIQAQREIELLRTQQDIKDQVQQELDSRQRELYLREQLKAIRRELGESDGSREVDELREKLLRLELPAEARAEVDRELARLERSGAESMDAQVIRTYLTWISELPWNKRSEDTLDLERAARVLDEDHFGLSDVKDRVLALEDAAEGISAFLGKRKPVWKGR